jgi:hypothetical protein
VRKVRVGVGPPRWRIRADPSHSRGSAVVDLSWKYGPHRSGGGFGGRFNLRAINDTEVAGRAGSPWRLRLGGLGRGHGFILGERVQDNARDGLGPRLFWSFVFEIRVHRAGIWLVTGGQCRCVQQQGSSALDTGMAGWTGAEERAFGRCTRFPDACRESCACVIRAQHCTAAANTLFATRDYR